MAVKSFKKTSKKSIVAGSPAIEEHEQIMSSVRAESDEPAPSGSPATPAPAASASGTTIGVFSTLNTEPLKNVQTRVPLSIYEKLNRMKYFAGQRTSIGDIVAQAIQEYCDRHPV